MMLKSFEECADHLEAVAKSMPDPVLQAAALRRGEVNILALSAMRRETEKLAYALKSVDHLVAVEQGRA